MLALLMSLALAGDALPEVPGPRPRAAWGERLATPRTAVAMGVGLGVLEVSARLRRGFVSVEPRVAVGVGPGAADDAPWAVAGDPRIDLAAGLDVRGYPLVDRRWEVGPLIGLAWGASLAPDADGGTLHRHRVLLRVGAGVAYRPAPWNSVGLDLTAEPLVAVVTPTLGAAAADPGAFVPSVVARPQVGFSVRWILWFGASAARTEAL